MYKDDIRDLYAQKREARMQILDDFLKIYIRLRLFFPSLDKERTSLTNLIKMYLQIDRNEGKVLKAIAKQYGHLDDHEGVDELLCDFDDMFIELFEYCSKTFQDYEEFLELYGCFSNLVCTRVPLLLNGNYDDNLNYIYWMQMRKLDFPIFDEEYKNKVLMMLPALPQTGDDMDGEV